jgi:hypothetical protein
MIYGLRRGIVLKMSHSVFQRPGIVGGYLITEERYLGCSEYAFLRVKDDPVCLKTAEESSEMLLMLFE